MALADKPSNSPLDPRIVTPGGHPSMVQEFVEAATQTYTAGTLVSVSTANDVTGAAASGLMADVNMAGLAVKDSTGTTGAAAPLIIPDHNSEILIRGGASGVAATVTTTLFPLGQKFDIYVDANGAQTLDSDSTTNEKLMVVGYVKDVNGDYTQWLRTRPIAATWAVLDDSVA